MIHDLDESLRTLVQRDALNGTEVDVVFDAPTKEWSSRRNAPTVDLYLYDIREDLRRRAVGRAEERRDGVVVARNEPPRWYKLSYLVTAWTQRPEDEHRLLAALLRCFLLRDRLPEDVLAGSLAGVGYPIPYTCGLPPPEDRALSDVWSALGGELKPSLDLVVVAPFDLTREIEIGPPVLEEPRVAVRALAEQAGAESVPSRQRRGKAPSREAEAPAAAAAGGVEPPTAAEERSAGSREQPGRVIRIRELPRDR